MSLVSLQTFVSELVIGNTFQSEPFSGRSTLPS
jgi:hypothetical protein